MLLLYPCSGIGARLHWSTDSGRRLYQQEDKGQLTSSECWMLMFWKGTRGDRSVVYFVMKTVSAEIAYVLYMYIHVLIYVHYVYTVTASWWLFFSGLSRTGAATGRNVRRHIIRVITAAGLSAPDGQRASRVIWSGNQWKAALTTRTSDYGNYKARQWRASCGAGHWLTTWVVVACSVHRCRRSVWSRATTACLPVRLVIRQALSNCRNSTDRLLA